MDVLSWELKKEKELENLRGVLTDLLSQLEATTNKEKIRNNDLLSIETQLESERNVMKRENLKLAQQVRDKEVVDLNDEIEEIENNIMATERDIDDCVVTSYADAVADEQFDSYKESRE